MGKDYIDNKIESENMNSLRAIAHQLDRLNNNIEKMLKIVTAMKDEFYG